MLGSNHRTILVKPTSTNDSEEKLDFGVDQDQQYVIVYRFS